jgi:Fe2+ or Zn2+ uptake regulation protein
VDTIFNDLKGEIPSLSRATVYNTMALFLGAKLVRVIPIDDNETRYDIVTHNHGHFKCESCGSIHNFSIDFDGFVTEGLDGFRIEDKNVYFRGRCPACLRTND